MEANFVEAMKSIIIPSYDTTCLDFFSLSETTYIAILSMDTFPSSSLKIISKNPQLHPFLDTSVIF